MKRALQLAASALISSAVSAQAQDVQKTNPACWEIISPAQAIAPYSLVLFNRCEGKTWIMTKVSVKGPSENFVWRWSPLFLQEGESVLQYGK